MIISANGGYSLKAFHRYDKFYYYWMRKIKQESLDSLSVERKSRIFVNPRTFSFAEVPISKPSPMETIRIYLTQTVVNIPDYVSDSTTTEVLHAVNQIC